MITNTGKDILARYLIGKAPAYASYIAFGCGPQPKESTDTFSELETTAYSQKTSLDFEMFRAPIISRGYVNNGDISEIVFTAEIPTTERYEITEVGIFSAASNPASVANDSRLLLSFSNNENWQIHGTTTTGITSYTERLDSENSGNIEKTDKAFFANADNAALDKTARVSRFERTRFLNNTLFVRGDLSTISGTSQSTIAYGTNSPHIHLTNVNFGLDSSSPDDEIRMVFSVINKELSDTTVPSNLKLIVEFASSDSSSAEYARLKYYNATLSNDNRYLYVSQKISELETSGNFSWNLVNIVKIYVAVDDTRLSGTPTPEKFYLALDAVRFENTTSFTPVYGLTGYTVIKNTVSGYAQPIIKLPNTTNMLEFRFAMDVI